MASMGEPPLSLHLSLKETTPVSRRDLMLRLTMIAAGLCAASRPPRKRGARRKLWELKSSHLMKRRTSIWPLMAPMKPTLT